ncbi:hypothetical protein AB3662_44200 [Sorangium cellulosum]|uniref:hypothetical protein n=1 Tax=Sorangium cellulosum TaxID=56 RepID=UPI003D9A0BAF
MVSEQVWDIIRTPPEEHARTEALRSVLQDVMAGSTEVPDDVRSFLATHVADDTTQGALLGLILFHLIADDTGIDVPEGVLARIFPVVLDPTEPELRAIAVSALRGRSPRGVYRDVALFTTDPGAAVNDLQYAFRVLSRVQPDDLKVTFEAYLVS